MSKASPLFEANGYFSVICTNCANELFTELKAKYNDEYFALQIMCHYLDTFFSESLYEDLKGNDFSLGKYLSLLNGLQYKSKNFTTYLTIQNQDKPVVSPIYNLSSDDTAWSDTERNNRDIAIETIGYDPFEGYDDLDRRFLFNDLIRYFDDDIGDDPFKLSVVVQIVNTNLQIRKIDLAITRLQATGNSAFNGMLTDECKNLTEIKSKLIASSDKIAKENEISVKNRSNKELGKSTLGYLQRDLRSKGFKKAEENYYEQLASPGTFWAVDMSHKAVLQNALFDENDKREIFETQRKLITDLQRQLDEALEDKRLLRIELAGLKENIGDHDEQQ